MTMLKVGIIGVGLHGSRYAQHLVTDVEGMELVAVCRRSEAVFALADRWDCRGYTDWQQLVADNGVEAVISVLPPMLNLEVSRAVAAAGKPLLIEKPLAGTVADGEKIVSLFQDNNIPLTVGQTLRYNQVIAGLKEQLPQLGKLYSFYANQRLEPSTLGWHENPEIAGAGVSFHTAVHVIDALSCITGLKVKRLIALAGRHHNQSLEDLLTVMVEMENGVVGTVDCSKVAKARSGRFEFVCEEGQLFGEQVHNQLGIIRGRDVETLDPGSPVPTILPLLEQWRDFLVGTADNPVTGEQGLAALRFCDGCLRSAANGSWVSL